MHAVVDPHPAAPPLSMDPITPPFAYRIDASNDYVRSTPRVAYEAALDEGASPWTCDSWTITAYWDNGAQAGFKLVCAGSLFVELDDEGEFVWREPEDVDWAAVEQRFVDSIKSLRKARGRR